MNTKHTYSLSHAHNQAHLRINTCVAESTTSAPYLCADKDALATCMHATHTDTY